MRVVFLNDSKYTLAILEYNSAVHYQWQNLTLTKQSAKKSENSKTKSVNGPLIIPYSITIR